MASPREMRLSWRMDVGLPCESSTTGWEQSVTVDGVVMDVPVGGLRGDFELVAGLDPAGLPEFEPRGQRLEGLDDGCAVGFTPANPDEIPSAILMGYEAHGDGALADLECGRIYDLSDCAPCGSGEDDGAAVADQIVVDCGIHRGFAKPDAGDEGVGDAPRVDLIIADHGIVGGDGNGG
jgi:hypothetical protein